MGAGGCQKRSTYFQRSFEELIALFGEWAVSGYVVVLDSLSNICKFIS
jgi:hypothetical protein